MDRETFDIIKTKAAGFAFSSFEYLEYEHAASYQVVADMSGLILISGRNEAERCEEACWAANDARTLIEAALQCGRPLLVRFVPEEWKPALIKQGFTEYAIFRDYRIDSLKDQGPPSPDCTPLEEPEYEQAAAVTAACRMQSRGFHGETPEWIANWMNGNDPGAGACRSRDCTILARRQGAKPVGIVCIAIYGDDSPKGPIVWIREIAVAPEYQGRGYGKALLQSALAYGAERGAKRAFLAADDLNEGAIALYRSAGFEPDMSEAQIDMICEM